MLYEKDNEFSLIFYFMIFLGGFFCRKRFATLSFPMSTLNKYKRNSLIIKKTHSQK